MQEKAQKMMSPNSILPGTGKPVPSLAINRRHHDFDKNNFNDPCPRLCKAFKSII
jgi:hypothetical protein